MAKTPFPRYLKVQALEACWSSAQRFDWMNAIALPSRELAWRPARREMERHEATQGNDDTCQLPTTISLRTTSKSLLSCSGSDHPWDRPESLPGRTRTRASLPHPDKADGCCRSYSDRPAQTEPRQMQRPYSSSESSCTAPAPCRRLHRHRVWKRTRPRRPVPRSWHPTGIPYRPPHLSRVPVLPRSQRSFGTLSAKTMVAPSSSRETPIDSPLKLTDRSIERMLPKISTFAG